MCPFWTQYLLLIQIFCCSNYTLEGKEGDNWWNVRHRKKRSTCCSMEASWSKRGWTDLFVHVSPRQLCCALRHCLVVELFWLCLKPLKWTASFIPGSSSSLKRGNSNSKQNEEGVRKHGNGDNFLIATFFLSRPGILEPPGMLVLRSFQSIESHIIDDCFLCC